MEVFWCFSLSKVTLNTSIFFFFYIKNTKINYHINQTNKRRGENIPPKGEI